MGVSPRWRALLLPQSRSWKLRQPTPYGAAGSAANPRHPPLAQAAREATTPSQLASLSHKHARDSVTKAALFQSVTLDDRGAYFATSCVPITKAAEDDMETLSVRLMDRRKGGTR